MGKSLSYVSSEATQKTNVTGETTPILEIEPDDGTLIRLLNRVSQGDAKGLPIIAKLRSGANTPLPVDTKLILRAKRPTDDEPVAVSVAEDNIAPWNNLTTAEQRNEENIDSVKVVLKAPRVNIEDHTKLTVEVNSSAQISWADSELFFVREGVQERNFDG